jgi:hypothetical protein
VRGPETPKAALHDLHRLVAMPILSLNRCDRVRMPLSVRPVSRVFEELHHLVDHLALAPSRG